MNYSTESYTVDGQSLVYSPNLSSISDGKIGIGAYGGGSCGAYYMIIMPKSVNFTMPTFTIGSAQPFLSNGTEITHQHSIAVNPYRYNPTQESYTYNIYDSFNYNYITVIYNSSWDFKYSSIYANTTGTLPASIDVYELIPDEPFADANRPMYWVEVKPDGSAFPIDA